MQHSIPVPAVLVLLILSSPLAAQDRARPPIRRDPVRTQFDPRLDGMPFDNFGDYAAYDGICFGMSILAIDNYLRRMQARARGEPAPEPLPIARNVQDGNYEVQRLAALVHSIATVKDDGDNNRTERTGSGPLDPRPMRAALERIANTGQPEVLGIYGKNGEDHAAVVFGWEDGHLLVYDPNFPGETIRWPWDPVRGFGRHPRLSEDRMYDLRHYDSAPLSTFRTTRELAALRAACDQGLERCLGRLPQLQARVEGTGEGPHVVVGTATRGQLRSTDGRTKPPRRVWVVVDGKPVAGGRINPDGSFRIKIPHSTRGRRVQVVAATEDGALAGLNDVDAEPVAPSPPARPRPRGRGFTDMLPR